MLKKVFTTTVTKFLVSFFGLLIVILNSRQLGSEGLGAASLIILTISIILIINEIVVGGGLVYLVPKYSTSQIFIPGYLWSLFTAFLFYFFINKYLKLVDIQYNFHVVLLGLILTISSLHSTYLLGRQQVYRYNLIIIMQSFSQFLALISLYYVLRKKDINSYITSLYIGYLTGFFISIINLRKFIDKPFFKKDILSSFIKILKYGFLSQVANISQILNYRLCYYLIEKYIGLSDLGRFTISMQASESTWLISRSIALVQYSSISNSNDIQHSRKTTIKYSKITFIVSIIIMSILIIIPTRLYEFILGKDFTGIPQIMIFLFPGIVILSVAQILSPYFSGTGKIHINTIGSVIGLVVTIVTSLILIPSYGLIGAAISNTLSYIVITIIYLLFFLSISKSRINDFFSLKQELNEAKIIINKITTLLRKKFAK